MSEYSDPIPLESGSRRDAFASWARRLTDKVVLPLLVIFIAGVSSSAVGTWVAVFRLTDKTEQHERAMQDRREEIRGLEARLEEARTQMVTQAQMLETLKRVEQQLEITMLRARIAPERAR
jgi:hypothetical protein